jgi:hypothetical protein
MERCDRCAVVDKTVIVVDFCEICGPIPLCGQCVITHRRELAEAVDW